MRKSIRVIREEVDLAISLADHIASEEEKTCDDDNEEARESKPIEFLWF